MCLIWGTTWMAIKIGLEDMTPMFSLSLRFLIAGIILLIYIYLKERQFAIERKQLKLIVYLTCFNYVLPYFLIYHSLKKGHALFSLWLP